MAPRILLLVAVVMFVQHRVALAADDIRVADDGLFERLDANGDGLLAAEELPASQSRLFARLLRAGDHDNDGQLSEQEWAAAIQPRRPAKPIEEKRSSELPGADATRLLLLKLDADADGVLTSEEAPSELRSVLRQMVQQLDRNEDDKLNRLELSRGGPRLARVAQQTVRRFDWDVTHELTQLDREQGEAAMRFSDRPEPAQVFADPKQVQALFAEFDRNGDGKLTRDEVPEPAQDRLRRLFRLGDRDRDGALSEREFMAASERLQRLRERMNAGGN